ncbi:terminase large subunit domain-containing protein [Desulfotomaculum nigrificans]|uniref:terminase large subunit domain-containing protein n=1 Tax=Desulfotomaculum nigrificans TaxID=1565 RepID=UPI0001FAECDD|nr:terminase family protein [Desulfotomaculum nigrificans]
MARTARSTAEKLKIINADFRLWAKNFVKIVDNEGKEIPFILNEQQEYFYQNMDKFNIISKSRQLGFTTYSLAYCLWLACTRPNTNCLIVSYNVESTQSIFERLKQMFASIPDKYKPAERRNNRMELYLENNSRIIVKTAGVKSLGRGMTLQYILLSEFAFYPDDQQKDSLVSLEQALAKNEDSKIVIETTSNGYNYYQKLFMSAYKGNSKYKAFFFPWYSSATSNQFKHEIDLAEKWFRLNNHGHRMRPEDLERDEIPLREKGISFKLLMWRRWKLEDISIEDFNQEFPSTPEESFKATSRSVFDTQKITERLNYILPPLSRADIKKELPFSLDQYLGKGFFIYQNVKANERYYIGVDTASGNGGDYSAISVFDSQGEQVAVFYNNKIPVYRFAEIVNDLGHYFNYGFLVVEKNSFGQSVIEKLRTEYGYLNMYKHKTFDERGRKKLKIGWVTTSVSKPKLINDYKEQFELDLILLNDNETLEEMKIFTDYNGKTGNIRGEGNHDDMVIASALAIQGLKCGKWYV